MKGMKKLFALLAVLTMALTLTPMVTPVAAADGLVAEIVPSTATVYVGSTSTVALGVKATLMNTDISDLVTVAWQSEATDVATVDQRGVVTGVAEGTATISAVVTYTGVAPVKVYATVTVKSLPTKPSPEETPVKMVGSQDAVGSNVITVTVTYPGNIGSINENYLISGLVEITGANLAGKYLKWDLKWEMGTNTVTTGYKIPTSNSFWLHEARGLVQPTANLKSENGKQYVWTFSVWDDATCTDAVKVPAELTVKAYSVAGTEFPETATLNDDLIVLGETTITVKPYTLKVVLDKTQINMLPGQTAVVTASVITDMPLVTNNSLHITWSSDPSGDLGFVIISNSENTVTVQATATSPGGNVVVKVKAEISNNNDPHEAEAEFSVNVVKAAGGVILANASGKWIQAGGVLYYQVTYDVIGMPPNAQGQAVELKYGDKVLTSAQLGAPLAVPFDTAWDVLGKQDGILTLSHVGGTSTTAVPINFFKVETSLADSYKSGDYVTAFKISVTRQDGKAFGTNEVVPSFVITDGENKLFAIPSASLTLSTDKKKASVEFKDLEIRFTGGEDYEWYVIQDVASNYKYAADLAYKTIVIEQTTFKFSPAELTVSGTPTFKAKVYLTDANGEPVVKDTLLQVKYYYSDTASGTKTATVKLDEKRKSYFEIELPTPPKAGTYTATVTTKDPTRDQVDGKGTFTISLPGEIHMTDPALFTSTIGESVITVFAGEGKEDISKLWVTIDNPNGVVKKYVVDSASKVLVYKDGVYCEAPDPIDIYWTNINSSQANIKLNLVQGGSFKVTVKAQLKDGSTFSETKEYTNKMYRIESLTLTPTVPVYGKEAKMTLVVKDWAGDSVNNATITVDDRVVTPVEEVHGGKYVIDLGKALTDGEHIVEVYAGSTLMARKYFVAEGADTLKVTLTPTTVVAGKKVEGTVKDADDKVVNGTAVVQIDALTKYEVSVVNGKFTIDTSDAKFTEAKAYTVRVVDSATKNIGTAEFTITLPLTVVSPTDGLVNNGVADSIVVTTTSGLSPAKVGLKSSVIYVVEKGKLSVADAVSFLDEYDTTVEDNKVTLDFVAGANPKITCAELILKYGNYTATTFKLALPKLEIVQTATWYMGDTVPLKVKLTDAHGNPVAGITVTAQQLGYFNLNAKTGTDGIADFGDVYLNAAGNVVASVKLFGAAAGLEAKVTVFAARPTQDLKVTVTPTIVDAGKDALLTLTLVGADAKPVETGKAVVVTIGPSTYNGLVGANGVVTLTVKSESLTGTVVTGVVKVEGYNAATFTLAVKPAEEPEYKTVIELAPGMDVYTVNGETKFWDATPYIKNGRTLVPIRHLAEAVGFKASWDFSDPANKMVFIFKADQDPEKDKEHPFILLIIGQPTAMVNGNLVALDVAPEILNGRTMVPLRFVVETLGYQVEWLGNTIRLMK